MRPLLILLLLTAAAVATAQTPFKVIGYFSGGDPATVPLAGLTHVNFSFAIPARSGDTLAAFPHAQRLHTITQRAHQQGIKVFISVGGWGIGDAPGDDTRFHRMAATAAGRNRFVQSVLQLVGRFGLDGVDMDWEYPDENSPSAKDYEALMQQLADSLHRQGKQLSAAVISYGPKAYGVENQVFQYVDWLNLMAYDDDAGKRFHMHHSPYALAERTLDFWLKDRKLPAEKAVLGLPFYAKRGMGRYGPGFAELVRQGADPAADTFGENDFNGTRTITAKTRLARQHNCGGVMIWEIGLDAPGENSLLQAIQKGLNP